MGITYHHGTEPLVLQNTKHFPDDLPEFFEEHLVVSQCRKITLNQRSIMDYVRIWWMGRYEINRAILNKVQITGITMIHLMFSRIIRHFEFQPIKNNRCSIWVDIHRYRVPPQEFALYRGSSATRHRIQYRIPRFGIEFNKIPSDLRRPITTILCGMRRPISSFREAPDRCSFFLVLRWFKDDI